MCDAGCCATCSGVPAATTSPPPSPPSGPEVDHPVRGLDDVEVVLDDEQRVPRLEQLAERRQQLRDVVEVQPGRRLVEDVEQAVAAVGRQVRRDLDALRLAARERGRGLAQAQVSEADLVEHLQAAQHLGRGAEEGERLAHRHVEHLVDVPPAVLHLEHLRLEPLAVALLAGHEHVGQKLHLDPHLALALARLAPAARHVEGEVAGGEARGCAHPWSRRTARESGRTP